MSALKKGLQQLAILLQLLWAFLPGVLFILFAYIFFTGFVQGKDIILTGLKSRQTGLFFYCWPDFLGVDYLVYLQADRLQPRQAFSGSQKRALPYPKNSWVCLFYRNNHRAGRTDSLRAKCPKTTTDCMFFYIRVCRAASLV